MGKKEGILKKEILRNPKEIQLVKKAGEKLETEYFIIHYLANKEAIAPERKITFTISREIRKATDRNLLKRRMREVYRRNKDLFPPGYLFLIRAKEKTLSLPFQIFKERLCAMVTKI